MVDVHPLGWLALGTIGSRGAVVCGSARGIALRPGNGSSVARAPAGDDPDSSSFGVCLCLRGVVSSEWRDEDATTQVK